MLFAIVLPAWEGDAQARIQHVREAHDPQAAVVPPHVTLLFGARVDEAACRSQLAAVAGRQGPFEVDFSWATPWPNGDVVHASLVAGRGSVELARLHRRLHDGSLAACRSPRHLFMPHVTLGHYPDFGQALQACDHWNEQQPPVRGRVEALVLGRVAQGRFEVLDRFGFVGAA